MAYWFFILNVIAMLAVFAVDVIRKRQVHSGQ